MHRPTGNLAVRHSCRHLRIGHVALPILDRPLGARDKQTSMVRGLLGLGDLAGEMVRMPDEPVICRRQLARDIRELGPPPAARHAIHQRSRDQLLALLDQRAPVEFLGLFLPGAPVFLVVRRCRRRPLPCLLALFLPSCIALLHCAVVIADLGALASPLPVGIAWPHVQRRLPVYPLALIGAVIEARLVPVPLEMPVGDTRPILP
jgi:hypothetical protein